MASIQRIVTAYLLRKGAPNLVPPTSVAEAARKGLEYRQKARSSNKGGLTPAEASKAGIGSGVQRAVNLKNRDKLSPETVRRMKSFFDRHEKNKTVDPEHRNEPWNDKGYVSWLLWGGDAGRTWANKVVDQLSKSAATKRKRRQKGESKLKRKQRYQRSKHVEKLKAKRWRKRNPSKVKRTKRRYKRNPQIHKMIKATVDRYLGLAGTFDPLNQL